jgi:alpha-L-fucosidase
VDQHPPAPEWFQDAKFGLWTHWGAFSVAAYYSEWYPAYMFDKNGNSGDCYKHHVATFGDPFTTFGYDKFLTGGNDLKGNSVKFEPKLVSEGGKWDPDEWAQLFLDAGAKVAAPVGIHHDGFAMWDSKCTEWNSVSKGPKLDLVGLLAKAYRAHGMKLMVSSHDAYNFLGYYQYVPAQSDPSLKILYGQAGKPAGEALWLCELKELIDGYQPDHMWHDGSVGDISEATVLSYLSYYYNKGVEWGRDVVASNAGSDLQGHPGEIRQFERSGNGSLSPTFWISEESVSLHTWGYIQGMPYFSAKSILDALIDRVSMNGFFLLNISPMADGTIPKEQKDLLLTLGGWLKVFGESIYSTRPWTKCCEGPTTIGGNFGAGPAEGTATDIRFNRSKDNKTLYAIAMGWPSSNQMVITSLKSGSVDVSSIKGVTFLGDGSSLTYTQDGSGLKIVLPSGQNYPYGYAVKITFNGAIPTPK